MELKQLAESVVQITHSKDIMQVESKDLRDICEANRPLLWYKKI